ncbi:MAG: polyprenyl synthetase family protein [Candidatus Omnitrophica bacterium]|nr:polyprenyl synthetase family protein [Candidatus Omnitrophota bacterium]
MKYENHFKDYLREIEKGLTEILPLSSQQPCLIHEAMRYAVFPAGKRFRPVLVFAACHAAGGKVEDALEGACALELIHCYSLVHDDLPALDNDEMRRGRPTCHKQFGEAVALLAGDGLLTLAFQILAKIKPASKAVQVLEELSTSAGTYGMIGGQVADLTIQKGELTLPMLDYINIHKTGKLIKAAARIGALLAGASRDVERRMMRFGEGIGLAFQSIDDLLDGDGYLKLMKGREVRIKVRDLMANAIREIRPLGKRAENLQFLTEFLLKRIPRETHAKVD